MNKVLRIAALLAAVIPLATLSWMQESAATDATLSAHSFVDAFPTAQAGFAMRRPADRG